MLQDPEPHKVLLMADLLSRWSGGRFGDTPGVRRHANAYWEQDIVWAREHNIDYMPVVFPGFGWHNLKGATLGSIPHLDGQFLRFQVVASEKADADVLSIAIFDEGTALLKCSNNPPGSGF